MDNKRKVQYEEAQQYAKDSEIIHMEVSRTLHYKHYSLCSIVVHCVDAFLLFQFFIKTSAKTATNVKNLFVEIAKKLPKSQAAPERESFPIMPPKNTKKACC